MSDDAYDQIASVPKNSREEVRIALSEYRGTPLIDVRTFSDYSGEGELKPTAKGVSLRIARLPELIEALEKARAEAERRGLIGGAA